MRIKQGGPGGGGGQNKLSKSELGSPRPCDDGFSSTDMSLKTEDRD